MPGTILLVDDEPELCRTLETALTRRGYRVAWESSAEAAEARLRERDFDAVVTDLQMPGIGGIALCRKVLEARPGVPVVVMTAFGSLETAIEAIRAGAYDFLLKPFDVEFLVIALERAVQHRTLREEVRRLREAAALEDAFEGIVGKSPAMRKVFDLVSRVADTESTVLVSGDSGTGKEIIARAIHARSPRKCGPFLALDCAAMPETLLESELFGHAKGAFTDARAARTGLLVQANGGTLFLDEVGEMPLAVQPKLLRSLQERRVRPVGSGAEVPFDARIIAATNRDLESEVEEGRFRRDLFYRLHVIPVDLPPLRMRGNDILLLAQHFLRRFSAASGRAVSGITAAAAERLLAHDWPGNVRELQNCIERAVTLTACDQIVPDDLPEGIRASLPGKPSLSLPEPSDLVPLEEVERRYILRVLEASGGNRTMAARTLGLDRKTLYRKLDLWEGRGGPAKDGADS